MTFIEYDNFYYLGEDPFMGEIDSLEVLAQHHEYIAVDIETISLKNRTVIGIGIAINPDHGWYFPMYPDENPLFPWHLMEDPSVTKIFHNSMFDVPALWSQYHHKLWPVLDTMVACAMFGLPPKLKTLAGGLRLLKDDGSQIQDISDILMQGKTMLDVPESATAEKCAWDIRVTYRLFLTILGELDLEVFMSEMQVIQPLTIIQERGLRTDLRMVEDNYERLSISKRMFAKVAEDEFSMNPGSSDQVSYILGLRADEYPDTFEYLKLKRATKFDRKASFTTDKHALMKLKDPVAALVLNYRKVSTQLGTFIEPIRGLARVHTRFHLQAATTRISASGPDQNLMNIPKSLRDMYLPDDKVFTAFDYSQQELRILAEVSNDQAMKEVFNLGQDLAHTNRCGGKCAKCSIHLYTALAMGIAYDPAKNTGYAMIYGGSDITIMETAGISSLERAHDLGVIWAQTYPQAYEWIQTQQSEGPERGYVTTLYGRRIYLPDPDLEYDGIAGVERKAVNYPIQGTGAGIIKRALMECWRLGMDIRIPIHDELVINGKVQLPESLRYVLPGVDIPIEVKETATWT